MGVTPEVPSPSAPDGYIQSDSATAFDLDAHARRVGAEYQRLRTQYENLAEVTQGLIARLLHDRRIAVQSVDARAKTVESFIRKASTPLPSNPDRPKYDKPFEQITDLAGVRVITFFPRSVEEAERIISAEFDVVERSDKADILIEKERFGYQSVHLLVRLSQRRLELPEYSRFANRIIEVQVRTILQHAWAEIEHDIQYKSVATIPHLIRRRFMSLAGMLEIADREFQAIQDEDERQRLIARQSVQEGRLSQVEITADALKAYLDKRLGPDARMTTFSYAYIADQLKKFGFSNFQQIEECVQRYDPDQISRIFWGVRQGQIRRFEETLLAAMGENYVIRHNYGIEPWFLRDSARKVKALRNAGIEVGAYLPSPTVLSGRTVVLRAAFQISLGEPPTAVAELTRALEALPPRERNVVALVYGFDDGVHHSYEQISAAIGQPAWTVNEMHLRAMKRLEGVDASIS